MANNEMSIRFTDEMYATRKDVSNALSTSLIDTIWKQIEEYRSRYQQVLRLRSITKVPYRLTFSNAIVNKINDCQKRVVASIEEYKNFQGNQSEKQLLDKKIGNKLIAKLAMRYQIMIGEKRSELILSGKASDVSEKELKIIHYMNSLKELSLNINDSFSEELISRIYSILNDNALGYSLYRETELNANRSLFSVREYTSAPVNQIETMMANLIDFVQNSNQLPMIKFAATFYSIYLIKPYDELNEELALLMAKFVLAQSLKNSAIIYLPLEDIIARPQDRFKALMSETQRDSDLTYILTYLNDQVSSVSNNFADMIRNLNIDLANYEFHRDESLINEKETVTKQEEIVSKVEEVKPIIKEEPVEKEKIEPISIFKEDIVETKPIEKELPKEVIKEKPLVKDIKESHPVTQISEVSFNVPKDVLQLSERDAQKYERYLLETEPLMKKGQAHFYARHCTMGRYYTIQQYKRSIGCVYETARTSMDNLAELGYYKKEQIKNKFVYTPIKKAE